MWGLGKVVSAGFTQSSNYRSFLPAVSYEFTNLDWHEVGVPNVVEATFEIDPNRPDTIYMGSLYQGGWRSSDGGQNWEIMENDLPVTAAVRYIGTAPISPTYIFAGVRFLTPFRSWNGGDTWEAGTRPHSYPISALAVSPVTPTTVFWGNGVWDSPTVGGEVFRSLDGGDNWSEILPLGTMAIDIVVDPMNPEIVYIGCSGGGLLKSLDGGDSWRPMNNGLPAEDVSVRNILIHPDDSQIVYITADGRLYRSSDGGNNWANIGSGLPAALLTTLAMNPNSPEIMFATPVEGGNVNYGVYQSVDGGYSWQRLAPNPVNHYAVKMGVQSGEETSLFVLFNGYVNDDGRMWKLDLDQ